MDYLRTHMLTYMRAQAKHIAASMLYKFEKLKDVSGEYKTVKRASGKVHIVTKEGKKMLIPSKIINLEVHGARVTMFMALLEKVIIKVATNGRWITENAGPRMRKTLTVKDMMIANALDKRLTDSLNDGLAKDAPRPGNKEYNWTKIRKKISKIHRTRHRIIDKNRRISKGTTSNKQGKLKKNNQRFKKHQNLRERSRALLSKQLARQQQSLKSLLILA